MRIETEFTTGRNDRDDYLIVGLDLDVRTGNYYGTEPDPEKIGKCLNAAKEAFRKEWVSSTS